MPIEPEAFKLRDAASYDMVADRFDYWTERVTSPLADRVVELAGLEAGERVLDIGTGSGIVAVRAAARVGTQGETVGVDLSEGMLERARIRALSTVQFRAMDAEHLEFGDDAFDAVLSLYALLHFPDPEQAVREMFRVVKPGGRVTIGIGSGVPLFRSGVGLMWSRLSEQVEVSRGTLLVAPQALEGFIASRIPQAAEHETAIHGRPHSLESLLLRTGFRQLRRYWNRYTHSIETASGFWDLQTTFSSVVRKRLESAREQVVDSLRDDFLAHCEAVLARGGRLVYRNAALIVTAIRPENGAS